MSAARAWPRLVLVWAALICLLAASAITSWFDLGHVNLVIALVVAVLKSALVAVFFMRLRAAPGAVRLAVLLALLMLALLLGLSLSDSIERSTIRRVALEKCTGAAAMPAAGPHECGLRTRAGVGTRDATPGTWMTTG